MSNANPYAPPMAHVADVAPQGAGVQPVRNWSAQGRIGRLRYLAHLMAAYLLVIVVGAIGGFLEAMGVPLIGNVLLVGGVAVYLWFMILKTIQRSHDMDWSGWTSIAALIPLVGLVWLVIAGTEGQNRFGAPPPPNTTGVKVLAMIFPALFVIGILAAIAIPAYSDYQKRAQSSQTR